MQVIFLDEPSLSPHGELDAWVLNRPFVVQCVPGKVIVVPEGFITDLASVPKWVPFARSFMGGYARRAAILHDYLYAIQAGKKHADLVFLAAMKAERVNGAVRWTFYTAVRWFGHGIYERRGL